MTKWIRVTDTRLEAKGYTLWVYTEVGGRHVWQVTTNWKPPEGDGGYYNLGSLCHLRGIK